ncbi:MAG: hypothetical protein ACP5GH_07200 [Nitrososphaeria archaeon]
MYYIAVDRGTTGFKCSMYRNGRRVAKCRRRAPEVLTSEQAYVEVDPEAFYSAFMEILGRALSLVDPKDAYLAIPQWHLRLF